MRRIALTTVAGVGLLLSSCSLFTNSPTKISGNVPLRLLSVRGPFVLYGRPDSLFVDTSLLRLRTMVRAIPDPGQSGPSQPQCSPSCWPDAHDEPGVLYIAAQLQPFACHELKVIHADLGDSSTLQLWADVSRCPGGSASSASAALVLMEVPLNRLPRQTTLTVTLLAAPGQRPISSSTVRLP